MGPSWPDEGDDAAVVCRVALHVEQADAVDAAHRIREIWSITSGRRPSLKLGMHSMRVTRDLRLLVKLVDCGRSGRTT